MITGGSRTWLTSLRRFTLLYRILVLVVLIAFSLRLFQVFPFTKKSTWVDVIEWKSNLDSTKISMVGELRRLAAAQPKQLPPSTVPVPPQPKPQPGRPEEHRPKNNTTSWIHGKNQPQLAPPQQQQQGQSPSPQERNKLRRVKLHSHESTHNFSPSSVGSGSGVNSANVIVRSNDRVSYISSSNSDSTNRKRYRHLIQPLHSSSGTLVSSIGAPVDSVLVQRLLQRMEIDLLLTAGQSSSLIQIEDEVYRLIVEGTSDQSQSQRLKLVPINACQFTTSDNGKVDGNTVYDLAIRQAPVLDFTSLLSKETMTGLLGSASVHVPPSSIPLASLLQGSTMKTRSKSDVLIIFTTCNQLAITILSLQYLTNSEDRGDLLVIDDHSTDGTVEYLRKKGFAVITKHIAKGLTDSWNLGYRLGHALGYGKVIFTNNDILFTTGSIGRISDSLDKHALVCPLTTPKGAGHHPPQSIMQSHKLPTSMSNFIDDFRNSEAIQHTLSAKYPDKESCPNIKAERQGNVHFNGFCFGVNLAMIDRAAYSPKQFLFDPHDIVIGQEDHLSKKIQEHGLSAVIILCAFVYHFKSATVAVAKTTNLDLSELSKYNITAKRVSRVAPIVEFTYKKPLGNRVSSNSKRNSNKGSSEQIVKVVDLREDLRWYHPEEQKGIIFDLFAFSMEEEDLSKVASSTGSLTIASPSVGQSSAVTPDTPIVSVPSLSNIPSLCDLDEDQQVNNAKKKDQQVRAVNPSYVPSNDGRLELVTHSLRLTSHHHMRLNLHGSNLCIYPTDWHGVCNELSKSNKHMHAEYYAFASKSHQILIAFLLPDDDDRDYHTMIRSFSQALSMSYNNVQYLIFPSVNHLLSHSGRFDIDILVSLSPLFNVAESLPWMLVNPSASTSVASCSTSTEWPTSTYNRPKANLLTIAWIFGTTPGDSGSINRWFTNPSLGNFDMIFTGSDLIYAITQEVIGKIGLPVECSSACPEPNSAVLSAIKSSSTIPPVLKFASRGKPLVLKFMPFATTLVVKPPASTSEQVFPVIDYVIVTSSSVLSTTSVITSFDPAKVVDRKTNQMIPGRAIIKSISSSSGLSAIKDFVFDKLPLGFRTQVLPRLKVLVFTVDDDLSTWRSVDSLLLDAVSAGVIVLTNDVSMLRDTFPTMPQSLLDEITFSSTDSLTEKLKNVCGLNDDERKALIGRLQSAFLPAISSTSTSAVSSSTVSAASSWDVTHRAREFAELLTHHYGLKFQTTVTSSASVINRSLGSMGLTTGRRLAESSTPPPSPPSICVIMKSSHDRSMIVNSLFSLFDSLREYAIAHRQLQEKQGNTGPGGIGMLLNIYILNNDGTSAYTKYLSELAKSYNVKLGLPVVKVVVDVENVDYFWTNPLQGHDNVDRIIQHISSTSYGLQCPREGREKDNNMEKVEFGGHDIHGNDEHCDWILVTDGKHLYNNTFFKEIEPHLYNSPNTGGSGKVYDMITWNHVATGNKAIRRFTNQELFLQTKSAPIISPFTSGTDISSFSVASGVQPGSFDVGAIMVRSSRYQSGKYQRLSQSAFTDDLGKRDFYAMKKLYDDIVSSNPEKILHIEQVLSKT